MNQLKDKNYIFKGILIVQIMLMIDAAFSVYQIETSQLLSLVRYFMYFFGVYWIFKGVKQSHINPSIVYKVFILWAGILIVVALPELTNSMQNYVIFKSFISGKLFIYSLPILICSDLDTSFFKSLFKLIYYMILIYLILSIPVYFMDKGIISRCMSEYITFLLEGSIIFLMTMPYHKKKRIIIIVIAVITAIVIMMLLTRRNKVVFYGAGLGLAIILNILKGEMSLEKKFFIVFATIVGFIFLFNSGGIFDAFFYKMEGGMSSREQIIDDFYDDFNRTPNDWIYGRGLFGEFVGGVLNLNKNTGLRDTIENGYLQLILKGGWIWLGLLILVSVTSVYKGLFKSNNIFVKGCACIILLYFIDMIGFGVPVASLKYIMVFLSISVCSSKRWRSYSDNELKKIFAVW